MPSTRTKFWKKKFGNNMRRDAGVAKELRALDWRVVIIWECETKDPDRLKRVIGKRLKSHRC